MNEVYGPRDAMFADTRNFIRVKSLSRYKPDYIVPIQSGLILDGGKRTKFTRGDIDYGTHVYQRNDNPSMHSRLYKYTDGRCHYQEQIHENNKWKTTLKFLFNESSFTWSNVEV